MRNTIVAMALLATAASAGAKEIWQDPTRFEVNRLPARSIMVPCESAETALAIAKGEKLRTESKWLQSLNGTWGFKWKHNIDVADWEKTAEIAVPGCWQLQGEYDPALYTNVTYPIHGWNEGDPMVEPPKQYTSYKFRNPVGLYSRTFTVPADVTKVVIKVAKYKVNTTNVSVNGTAYTVNTNSNDGAYTDIEIDTTTTKSITFTTVSGGVRAMVNSITFIG